ncbi:MAG: NUDIX domain-containing protein [Henriciella sp.]|nr:NUDIX domain-containing protein [Henriciella sp.]
MPNLRTQLFYTWFRWSRPMTLGVRAAVENSDGAILIVRHTYTPGWYLPGGGVEHGEPVLDALARELREEGGVDLIGAPALYGVYSNHRIMRNDHVIFYRVKADQWQLCTPDHGGEIAEVAWVQPGDVPDDITPGNGRRFAELFEGAPVSRYW